MTEQAFESPGSEHDKTRTTHHASRRLLADSALLVVTLIWGSTFVMVKDAVASYPVFSFLALRFAFAAVALLPFILLRGGSRRAEEQRSKGAEETGRRGDGEQRSEGTEELGSKVASASLHPRTPAPLHPRTSAPLLLHTAAPLLIGLALFAGYTFQTTGLRLTTPAKAGFITGLSVVIVPLAAALLLRQPPERNAWIGVGLALAGLAMLSLTAAMTVDPGDLLVLGCAVAFAAHILLTGHFSPRYDSLWLTLGQILTVAILSGVAALLVGSPPGPAAFTRGLTSQVLFAAAFTGILATSFAFGIQTIAQRFTTSTHTALIFAAEPVFAGLFSFLLIGEVLGPRQLIGCGLILAGMVVAEMKRDM